MATDPASSRAPTRPLNLVWRRDTLNKVLEAYFIKEVLLGALGRPVRVIVFDKDEERVFADDLLIVVRHANRETNDNVAYLAEARRRGCRNLGVFHMGDEYGDVDLSFYADADYVIRNYHFPHALKTPTEGRPRMVLWAPNGFATGVGPRDMERQLSMSARSIVAFFCGYMGAPERSPERHAMVRVVQEHRLPAVLIGTGGFSQGLSPSEYAGHLENTRFALVPKGNSPETIRLYDALEAGCIPIALETPFFTATGALGSAPFVILRSWQELPAFLDDYLAKARAGNSDHLEDRRRAIASWWRDFKAAQQRKIKMAVDAAFAAAP
jgi:hypothetical protein